MLDALSVSIPVAAVGPVSGLWLRPPATRACLVLAHGAGVGMAHKSMAALADGLAQRHIATLRFQFPYMEKGSGRPDSPPVAHVAVRAAVAEANRLAPDLALFAGGRSFGGRMTSQAEALAPLTRVSGLVFFAFPLHPAGKPSIERAVHLAEVPVPMLFLQGTRDALAEPDLLKTVAAGLSDRATLIQSEDADHSFHVAARTGRKDADVLTRLLDDAAAWMVSHLP